MRIAGIYTPGVSESVSGSGKRPIGPYERKPVSVQPWDPRVVLVVVEVLDVPGTEQERGRLAVPGDGRGRAVARPMGPDVIAEGDDRDDRQEGERHFGVAEGEPDRLVLELAVDPAAGGHGGSGEGGRRSV